GHRLEPVRRILQRGDEDAADQRRQQQHADEGQPGDGTPRAGAFDGKGHAVTSVVSEESPAPVTGAEVGRVSRRSTTGAAVRPASISSVRAASASVAVTSTATSGPASRSRAVSWS